MLTEAEGCAVLRRVFAARGYAIEENVPFAEAGVSFEADGWDAGARVGYEYLTHEAGDHDDLRPDEIAALAKRMDAGELYVLIVDEPDVESAEALAGAAQAFLDEVERRKAAR